MNEEKQTAEGSYPYCRFSLLLTVFGDIFRLYCKKISAPERHIPDGKIRSHLLKE